MTIHLTTVDFRHASPRRGRERYTGSINTAISQGSFFHSIWRFCILTVCRSGDTISTTLYSLYLLNVTSVFYFFFFCNRFSLVLRKRATERNASDSIFLCHLNPVCGFRLQMALLWTVPLRGIRTPLITSINVIDKKVYVPRSLVRDRSAAERQKGAVADGHATESDLGRGAFFVALRR